MKQWTAHRFVLHMKVRKTQHSIYRTVFQIFKRPASNYIFLGEIWKGCHRGGGMKGEIQLQLQLQGRGRRPTPLKPWVATQTGFKERLSPRPLKIPGSFTARYRLLAMFQQPHLLPQNPAAARFPSLGLQTARTDTRFSTSRFGVIFESGQ
ncbi:hypothetical protein IV435_14170 [Rahnella sp. SAP-29]|nr:hypothetical protein [Rahnella laticis]